MAATLQGGRRRLRPSVATDPSGADRPIQISTFMVLRRTALAAALAFAAVIAAVGLAVSAVSFDDWTPPPATALDHGRLAPAPSALADTGDADAHAPALARRTTARRSATGATGPRTSAVRPRARATRPAAPAGTAAEPTPDAVEPALPGPIADAGPDAPDGAGPDGEPQPAEPVRDAARAIDDVLE